jgi:hypothetical protein
LPRLSLNSCAQAILSLYLPSIWDDRFATFTSSPWIKHFEGYKRNDLQNVVSGLQKKSCYIHLNFCLYAHIQLGINYYFYTPDYCSFTQITK